MISYEKRFVDAQKMYQLPIDDNCPGQKFLRGQRVHIAADLGEYMRHFRSDIDAIISYTYAQKFGGTNTVSYNLLLFTVDGELDRLSAWYEEHQLTLVDMDVEVGLKVLSEYAVQAVIRNKNWHE